MRKTLLCFASAAILSACNSGEKALPVPEMTEPEWAADGALPVAIRSAAENAAETPITGRLIRRGPCIVLEGANGPALILWGEDVTVEQTANGDWFVRTRGDSVIPAGSWLQGRGRVYGSEMRVEDLAIGQVPSPCTQRQALQLHSTGPSSPPTPVADAATPPPPLPPPPPSMMDPPSNPVDGQPDFPSTLVSGYENPRNALFSYVLTSFRNSDYFGGRPICLRDSDANTVALLGKRFTRLHAQNECGWSDGGVILIATGEPALYIRAVVDCSGRSCNAEGGATYGNLGAESFGYFIERTERGWIIRKNGMMTVS